jgi:TM2 domain-containing membrane protein YozV
MDMNYFIADGNVQRGPFPMGELLAQGLKRDSLVWREGMAQWEKAETLAELSGLLGSGSYQAPPGAVPPPPPPPNMGQYYAPPSGVNYSGAPPFNAANVNSQKIAAGICGILIGGLGIHKFILGMTGAGLIMLLVSILTCGIGGIVMHVIGIIEGIVYLTKTDEQFYQTYMVEQKAWF